MKKVIIITSFTRFSDLKLSHKARTIQAALTNNPNFPEVPYLSNLQTAMAAFSTAISNKRGRNRVDTAEKKEARKALETILIAISLFVQTNCHNSGAIALCSGFDIKKPNTPIGVLPKPGSFKVQPGPNKGSVKLRLERINGAGAYQYEFTPTPVTADSVWLSTSEKKSSAIISNLQSGREYAFRVTGVGSHPTRVYSNIITSFVL
jgi:hypothetical protein